MCTCEHHSYLPLNSYVCTLTRQRFEHGTGSGSESIMKAKPNLTPTLEEFSLTKECMLFIEKHTCENEQKDLLVPQSSQSMAQSTSVQLEPPPPVVTVDDDTTEKQK